MLTKLPFLAVSIVMLSFGQVEAQPFRGGELTFLCLNGVPFTYKLGAMRSGLGKTFKGHPLSSFIVSGDTITSVNGTPITGADELADIAKSALAGFDRQLRFRVRGSYEIERNVDFQLENLKNCDLFEAEVIINKRFRQAGFSRGLLKEFERQIEEANFSEYQRAKNDDAPKWTAKRSPLEQNSSSPQATKKNLVLLPVSLPNELKAAREILERSVSHNLGRQYNVFSGSQIQEKLDVEFAKEDCSAETCMQNLAIEFNGELIADVRLDAIGQSIAVSVQINNVLTGGVESSSFDVCNKCEITDILEYFNSI